MSEEISRRKLLAGGLLAGAGIYGVSLLGSGRRSAWKGFKPGGLRKGVFVARGDDPREMTRRALAMAGGIGKLVSKGDRVLLKPNIAWDRPPEMAANTNPAVVAAVVELCREAGAGQIVVMDHTCSSNPAPSYKRSGIADAAAHAGASVKYVDKNRFVPVAIEDGFALDSWAFYEDILTCDVLINLPVAKHHSTSKLTMSLKNVFGMVGLDRGKLHKDIHRKIADLNRVTKVDLVVMDAYRRMVRHGPTGGRLGDVDNSAETSRRVIVSTDRVAADAYGATLFGYRPEQIGHISFAHDAGLGSMDLKAVGVQETTA